MTRRAPAAEASGSSPARKERRIDPGRTLASILGAPTVAYLVGAALIAFLPVRPELAFAIGAHAMIPLWAALACVLPLARSGRRAWLVCLGIAGPLALALHARSHA